MNNIEDPYYDWILNNECDKLFKKSMKNKDRLKQIEEEMDELYQNGIHIRNPLIVNELLKKYNELYREYNFLKDSQK